MSKFLLVAGALLVGCGGPNEPGSAGSYGDYAEENTTVVGSDTGGGDVLVSTDVPADEDCVDVGDGLCVPTSTDGSTWCEREGGPVDVVIVDGEVVEVICYPPATDEDRPLVEIDATTEGDIDLVQSANNTTVVFNDELDGVPFVGDLGVDGNNVAVYGNGVENTIIDGDVVVSGNNVRLRGLTVTGDVHIELNQASMVMCRVLGSVFITKNGSVFVENDVFGELHASGNNLTLVGNDVQGVWEVTGQNDVCDDDNAFSDTSADQLVQDEEMLAPLACP